LQIHLFLLVHPQLWCQSSLPYICTSVTFACPLLLSWSESSRFPQNIGIYQTALGYILEDLDFTMHMQGVQFIIRPVPTDDTALLSHGPAAVDNNL
jgi:hypothetical protein